MRPRPDRILDYREYPVLYVDDEPENLRIFELTFRRELSIHTARSGEEGLARIHGSPVALVLSDHRMPGMTGVEFLARACEIDPRTIRMLVTAYGDAETLGHAINNGAIYRFVPKPWNPDEMRVTLRRGIEAYALDREREQLLRELTLLNRVAKSMTQELALDPLLELLLTTVVDDLGYDAATMLFLDAREERLDWDRFVPREDAVSSALREIELSRATVPAFLQRLRDGEAQMLSLERALELEAAMRRWVTEVAAEQILVVPLVGKKRTLGAIAVDNRRGGKRFTADDQTLLEGLATQAAIALENARLVEDLRRSREQLRQRGGLGALGAFAAGLAHELNNPLVSIQTFLQLAPAKRGAADPEFWGGFHDLACRELERIRSLVATLQSLRPGAGDAGRREPVDPSEVAREVAAEHAPLAAQAGLTLRVDAEPAATRLVAVRDQLQQILGHLVRNAIEASPKGGEVLLRVAPAAGCDGVVLEVVDAGEGIPEEILAHVFEPFVTTRGPERGAGLGLLVCHQLVSDHGGSIEVRSREGAGTTVCVRLPTTGSPAPQC